MHTIVFIDLFREDLMRSLISFIAFLVFVLVTCFACVDAKESSAKKSAASPSESQDQSDSAVLTDEVSGHGLTNLFFLHHSTGSGVVNRGDVRSHISSYNKAHGTSFEFWDHG